MWPREILSPTRRRRAVQMIQDRHGFSERRACRLVGQPRATQRRPPPAVPDAEERIRARSLGPDHGQGHRARSVDQGSYAMTLITKGGTDYHYSLTIKKQWELVHRGWDRHEWDRGRWNPVPGPRHIRVDPHPDGPCGELTLHRHVEQWNLDGIVVHDRWCCAGLPCGADALNAGSSGATRPAYGVSCV
jgi:hypothetical protein